MDMVKVDLSGVFLDVCFMFDSFVVGKLNELVNVVVCCVVEGGFVSFNLLFFYGGVGFGKIYFMYVIVWEL